MPAFREGLSFDDVLLIPKQTTILPSEVDTSTEFLPGITLKTPIVSAPMDTVTDARLAIAMAREGGVGVLHRNMPIEAQAAEVDRVKRSESGVITKPFHLGPCNTIQDAVSVMEQVPHLRSSDRRRIREARRHLNKPRHPLCHRLQRSD